MKILVASPGKLKTCPMGAYATEALLELGHDASHFDFSSYPVDSIMDRFLGLGEEHFSVNHRFRSAVTQERPELVIVIFGFDLSDKTFEYLKRLNIPTVCWWINDPFQFERSLKRAGKFNILFTNSMISVKDYRARGIERAHWLPTAFSPNFHQRKPLDSKLDSEVCFAGDWSPLREKWCLKLHENYRIKIVGPWGKKIAPNSPLRFVLTDGYFSAKEMSAEFSRAQIVFNIHTWFGKYDHGTNPRLFEAAGIGVCQAVDWKQDLHELFDVDGDLIVYTGESDLLERLGSMLGDTSACKRMAQRSFDRASRDHTYVNRMRELLSVVSREL
jgi:spore maturation protein CgeB